jgi:hypothetical protein
MTTPPRAITATVVMAVALLSIACSSGSADLQPTSVPATLGATAAGSPSPSAPPSATASVEANRGALQVIGGGSYPGISIEVPDGWSADSGQFDLKTSGPVMGVSVWDVGRVARDPCHWRNQLFIPGASVDDLVEALRSQSMRHASTPVDVMLAGYRGKYLEWSVPASMVVTGDADFTGCDVEPSNGHLDFVSWQGAGGGERYQQVAGQVDRLWVLDVSGQRLVVDATYAPDTTAAERDVEQRVVESLRFTTH